MKNYLGIVLMVLGLLLVPRLAPAQCPMCKAAVTSGSDYGAKKSNLVSGLNTGILYLFVLPYGSLLLIGVVVVVHYRRRKREEAQELSDTTVEDVIGNHQPIPRGPEE